MQPSRSRLLSGIAPSGRVTLGNYLGAVVSWLRWQDTCDCFFPLVDLHALTVPQDPGSFADRCRDFVALYLACGVDPGRSTVFLQSHVAEHCELAWLLQCHATVGELDRMTQFKDKRRAGGGAGGGLFTYPVLMAADILLYGTARVPVGDDQRQHLELTRDLAMRMNRRYGPLFTVPEACVSDTGARIMGLQDPTRKMSKSDPVEANVIALLDAPDAVARKLRRAVTDSDRQVVARADKPGVTNLLNILAAVTDVPVDVLEDRYQGSGYGRFKRDVADAVIGLLAPIQQRYAEIRPDAAALDAVVARGAERARAAARPIMSAVRGALGLIPC